MRRFTGGWLTLGACFAWVLSTSTAAALSLVWKTHVISAAGGHITGGRSATDGRLANEADVRLLDIGVGPRLGGGWSVLGCATFCEVLPQYIHSEDLFTSTVLGVGVVYAPSLDESPRAPTCFALARGCNEWGPVYPYARFVEATLGIGFTHLVVNPSVEVSWRHEFGGPAYLDEYARGRLRVVLRLGVGGFYEHTF